LAYGRIYIDNLRKKVAALFDELRADNRLDEDNFIEAFKSKYPKDYAMLQYEWEFKVHEFKKNRKGNPKTHPIRPEKILSNMYRNYYFKLVKSPAIKKSKERSVKLIQTKAGQYGYRIREDSCGGYNVINKETKEIEYKNLTYSELSKKFSKQGVKEIMARKEEHKKDG